MIDKLFIMYEHGTCVFEKIYYTRLDAITDSQIFSGFLSAISSFAKEALGSGLQSIQLQTGEQLAIMKHDSGIIGICLADGRDHDKLISSLLKKILDRFYQLFKKEIDVQDASLMGKTENFGKEVDAILHKKATTRAPWKMILGVILGFSILAISTFAILNRTVLNSFPGPLFLAIAQNPFYMFLFGLLGEEMGSILAFLMFLISFLFFIPALVIGFFAGNKTKGLFGGLIITLIAYLILFLASVQINANTGLNLKGWILSFSPLILFLTLSVSYVAGYIAERAFLYSSTDYEKKMPKLEGFFNSLKEKIGL
ncbi:MAG: hypothetical protein ACTSRG_23335 [Candidatus Helarchaeota archaeon]